MKKTIITALFAASALTLAANYALAQSSNVPMHKTTVEVGSFKAKNGTTRYVVKMDGKMYGMIELSELEALRTKQNMDLGF